MTTSLCGAVTASSAPSCPPPPSLHPYFTPALHFISCVGTRGDGFLQVLAAVLRFCSWSELDAIIFVPVIPDAPLIPYHVVPFNSGPCRAALNPLCSPYGQRHCAGPDPGPGLLRLNVKTHQEDDLHPLSMSKLNPPDRSPRLVQAPSLSSGGCWPEECSWNRRRQTRDLDFDPPEERL